MKATEQYSTGTGCLLCCTRCFYFLSKAAGQHFTVGLFIMLYKVVLTFESVVLPFK